MNSSTMTIDAMDISRVRSVCPQVGRVLLAGTREWIQGTTVPASALALTDAPTSVVGGFGADAKDLEFRPFGEPPV
jgi:hypothetical protein